MKPYFKYLIGLLRHKWFVFLGCLKMNAPLHLAVFHDWTKFLPIEFFPYVRQFYNSDGTKRDVRDATGAYDPTAQAADFQFAWLHHQRNKHHWQAWCVMGDGGSLSPLQMPEKYVREMIGDWIGAGMSYNCRPNPRPWYKANKRHMILHDHTRALIERLLKEKFA